MNIISYRGPGNAGGVSPALTNIWHSMSASRTAWWHIQDLAIERQERASRFPYEVARIPKELLDGHYRYCNEFLWPLMHDLPEHATYSAGDRELYRQFNWTLAHNIGKDRSWAHPWYFVQDYQLAFLPAFLKRVFGKRTLVFWHIPWPRTVQAPYVSALADLARSLLNAEAVGFHTREYADNFSSFVKRHLPELAHLLETGEVELLAAPLGIDVERWSELAEQKNDFAGDPRFAVLKGKRFVLSVDRADYTKGVLERLEGIDRFFERHPEFVGDLSFLQICGRTRAGVNAFDRYWQECRARAERLVSRWSRAGWQPLVWVDTPVQAEELAALYREASVMLVNPVRDGLNLTAKEYAACQVAKPGVLLLSPGAGAWHEIGQLCVTVNPAQPEQISDAIELALTMGESEKSLRCELIKRRLKANTLSGWWNQFTDVCAQRETVGFAPSNPALGWKQVG